MLISYLKTALRSLIRHRFFSAINVFGLAVAMSICMALIMLVGDQLSYDRYNTRANRIYRVKTIDVDSNGEVQWENQWNAQVCMPLGPELEANYTGIEKSARLLSGFGNGWLELENHNVNIPLSGFFADPVVLEFFEYELQYGDPKTALVEPYSVVITRKAADRLFREDNPLGRTIKVGNKGIYTVTGVLKETKNKSHIVFEALGSMSSVRSLEASGVMRSNLDNWTLYWSSWTYLLAGEGKSQEEIQEQLDIAYDKHIASITNPGLYKMKFALQPLLDITPGEIMNNSIGPQLPWIFVYFLSGLTAVILLTSCFNFTNLSIARSLTRAREIGVRKVSGAARQQIFAQFMTEAIVVAFVALAAALVLLEFLKPMILQLSLARWFKWGMYNGVTVYLLFAAFTLVVGLLAGFFPAVVMAKFQPVQVLKSLTNLKLFSRMGLRKALMVSQLAISIFFIMTVIVIYKQLNLFTHQDHGFNMKNNIVLKLNKTDHAPLKIELQKYANIISVAAASHVPAAGSSHGAAIMREHGEPSSIDAGYFHVDEDYAANMQLHMRAGQFFTVSQGESGKNLAVINEAASKKLRFERPADAVGETFEFLNDSTTKTIIGVVADYNHRDLTQAIAPLVLLYDTSEFRVLQISFAGNFIDAARSIDKAWATVNPGLISDYKAVESEINQFYEIVFGDLVKVIASVSVLAILISCLGLLGMATYATETRVKEISIRKVLGSTRTAIVLLLSKGFARLLAFAVAIGMPLAWLFNSFWLDQIAYRATIGIGTIVLSISCVFVFGLLTVGSQTLRASGANPVDHLKSE